MRAVVGNEGRREGRGCRVAGEVRVILIRLDSREYSICRPRNDQYLTLHLARYDTTD